MIVSLTILFVCGSSTFVHAMDSGSSDPNRVEASYLMQAFEEQPVPLSPVAQDLPSSGTSSLPELIEKIFDGSRSLQDKGPSEQDLRALISLHAGLIPKVGPFNRTPLHWAAANGLDALVLALIENHAELDPRDSDENTPLHLAAANGNDSTLTQLIHKGAKLHLLNHKQETPLHLAAKNGIEESVFGFNVPFQRPPYFQGGSGNFLTSLGGRRSHYPDCLIDLKEAGSDLEAQDAQGLTALQLAAERGCKESLQTLISLGANLTVTNASGCTLLHLTSRQGHEDCVLVLLENGALVNACDQEGLTPLHLAAAFGHDRLVALLIGKQADQSIASLGDGLLPLHLAVVSGHGEVAQRLLLSWTGSIHQKTLRDRSFTNVEGGVLPAGSSPLDLARLSHYRSELDYFIQTGTALIAFQEGRIPNLIRHILAGKSLDCQLLENDLTQNPKRRLEFEGTNPALNLAIAQLIQQVEYMLIEDDLSEESRENLAEKCSEKFKVIARLYSVSELKVQKRSQYSLDWGFDYLKRVYVKSSQESKEKIIHFLNQNLEILEVILKGATPNSNTFFTQDPKVFVQNLKYLTENDIQGEN